MKIKEFTKEELTLELIKELRAKITALPWFTHPGRNPKDQLRMDIYSGIKPDMNSEGPPIQRAITQGHHHHICHFHPVAESWAIYNGNTENDMSFLFHSPMIVDFLLKQIKDLEGEK